MADQKISALTGVTTAAGANEFAVNEAGTSKKVSLTQLETYLQTRGMPRVAQLTSQHSIASTTGTKVTGLDMTLEAGTYTFSYALVIRQATATGDGPQFGVNFTGTTTKRNFHLRYADATSAITAQTAILDDVGVKTFGYVGGMAHNAFSTTAPNLGTTIGVATLASDILVWIEGLLIVTVSGNLELWRASEGANASTTEVGSSLVVIRTA